MLAADPSNVEALRWSVVMAHREGLEDEAAALFRRVIAIDPENPVADTAFGAVLEARGDLAGAAICHRHAVKLRPQDAAAYHRLANLYDKAGDITAAIEHYRRAIA